MILGHHFSPNIQDIINTKLLELGNCNFEGMFIPHHILHVMCHKSCVTSHVSCVMRHVSCVRFQVSGVMSNLFFLLLFWSKWWSLSVEGLLSTEPTWLILSFFFLIMECCSSMIELTKKIIPPTVNLSIIMVKNA